MKKVMLALLTVAMVGMFGSCKDEWPGLVNTGSFEFVKNEMVVDIDAENNTFVIEGKYTEAPDANVRGMANFSAYCDDAPQGLFSNITLSTDDLQTWQTLSFTELENGLYGYEVEVDATKLTKELAVTFITGHKESNLNDKNTLASSTLVVTLRPR